MADADALREAGVPGASPGPPPGAATPGDTSVMSLVDHLTELRSRLFRIIFAVVLGGIVVWLFFTNPLETFVAAGWLLATYALISGITLTLLGLRLRRLR